VLAFSSSDRSNEVTPLGGPRTNHEHLADEPAAGRGVQIGNRYCTFETQFLSPMSTEVVPLNTEGVPLPPRAAMAALAD